MNILLGQENATCNKCVRIERKKLVMGVALDDGLDGRARWNSKEDEEKEFTKMTNTQQICTLQR